MRPKFRYKVVTHDRRSVVVPKNSKFNLIYLQGTIVKACNTVGIFCYSTKKEAVIFKNFIDPLNNQNLQIIKVKPLSRAKRVKYMTGGSSETMLDSFYNNEPSARSLQVSECRCYNDYFLLYF
jgi:hypothetical protein